MIFASPGLFVLVNTTFLTFPECRGIGVRLSYLDVLNVMGAGRNFVKGGEKTIHKEKNVQLNLPHMVERVPTVGPMLNAIICSINLNFVSNQRSTIIGYYVYNIYIVHNTISRLHHNLHNLSSIWYGNVLFDIIEYAMPENRF